MLFNNEQISDVVSNLNLAEKLPIILNNLADKCKRIFIIINYC